MCVVLQYIQWCLHDDICFQGERRGNYVSGSQQNNQVTMSQEEPESGKKTTWNELEITGKDIIFT